MPTPAIRPAIRITLTYILFSGAWILLSDRILLALVRESSLLTQIQTYKGWIFVLFSAMLIYSLLNAEIRARAASEARHRNLVEQASDGILVSDLEGRYVEVNASACTMLGYSQAELLQKRVEDLIPPEDFRNNPPAWEALRAGKTVRSERWLLRKDGTRLPVEMSVKRVDDGRIQAIARDIAERKRADEYLRLQVRRLDALHKVDLAISSSLDQRVTFNVLLDQVLQLLEVDAAAVLLIAPGSLSLEPAASRGVRPASLHKSLRVGEGPGGRVVLERKTIILPNLDPAGEDPARAGLVGEDGFWAYAGVPLIAKGQAKGVLEVYSRRPLPMDPEWIHFLETLGGQAAISIDNMSLYAEQQRYSLELSAAYDATLEGWSHALELRDQETRGHSGRVTRLTLDLAREMGFQEADLVHIYRGTLLHDIGKMGIPDRILLKPGPLNDEEWEVMRRHPAFALEMLAGIAFLRPALDIPYCHHERWDGSGYPRGLSGEEIPLAARIFSVVDVWDALTSDRPYRPAWSEAEAETYLRGQAGGQFDPRVMEVFMDRHTRGTGAAYDSSPL